MMYQNKLAFAVKSGGQVLREFKDTVYVPFSREYSLLIKNLNNTRVVVNITIDGENVTDTGLVVNANSSVDLERFMGSLDKGNRFKFIERTSSVEKHRGIGIEDGLIRVEFQFEKPGPVYRPAYDLLARGYYPPTFDGGTNPRNISRGATKRVCLSRSLNSIQSSTQSCSASATSVSLNDAGITVKGSISDQKFVPITLGQLETETYVMVLKLLGESPSGNKVQEPVTVKSKPKCTTCGRVNKATDKFCSNCGTSLEVI